MVLYRQQQNTPRKRGKNMTREEIIRKAYDFEIKAIENDDLSENPYINAVKELENGNEIWEAIDVAVSMKYGNYEGN